VDVEGALSTFAEVAVGLAGFAGIIAAFHQRAHQWSAADRNRFWSILIFAMATLFFSILPFTWLSLGISPWWWCSALFAVFSFGQASLSISLLVRHPPGFSRLWASFMAIGGLLAGLVQLLNAAELESGGEFAPYLVGLTWLVAASASTFLRLLYFAFLSADSADSA
jgi:hypothetical protein